MFLKAREYLVASQRCSGGLVAAEHFASALPGNKFYAIDLVLTIMPMICPCQVCHGSGLEWTLDNQDVGVEIVLLN
jgi:hypothetical protein